jgi:hypothetical protein
VSWYGQDGPVAIQGSAATDHLPERHVEFRESSIAEALLTVLGEPWFSLLHSTG